MIHLGCLFNIITLHLNLVFAHWIDNAWMKAEKKLKRDLLIILSNIYKKWRQGDFVIEFETIWDWDISRKIRRAIVPTSQFELDRPFNLLYGPINHLLLLLIILVRQILFISFRVVPRWSEHMWEFLLVLKNWHLIISHWIKFFK
jgi:hypothetical protein